MFKLEGGYDNMIDVISVSEYDSSEGHNITKVTLEGGASLTKMQSDLIELQADFQKMKNRENQEARLRDEHEGLKELYSQYKVVLKLVKTSDNALNSNGSS